MAELISKLSTASFKVRLFLTFGFYLLVYLLSIIFYPDEYSTQGQVVFSIIHLFFLIIVIRLLSVREKFTKASKIGGWILLVVTITMNIIPSSHGLMLHDNGFVPMWAMVPQTEFGWPFTFLRVFGSDISKVDSGTGAYLIHISALTFNLCITSILIVLELKLISSWRRDKLELLK